ncbi:C4-dicarboxylate ABC transporter permease [candidate division KSB3 bacterium]|uniref:C4-dicarboxylate ABC transporter permease n=1 Tax=candidate division KSB3 bacterium TaxID=2044937 RepID=A0A2G6KGG1_9BACT|nr:MAG: C4-dicarboxylate ABC transporter permease [candidate division KSB3 bacterium]
MISVLLIVSFLVLLLLGVPITFAMALATLGSLLAGEYNLQIIPQIMARGITNFTLMAVPLFILAGNLMNSMGLTERMFGFARALVGHIKGGLAHVNVVSSMIFAGISGSAAADCAGLGIIEIEAMTQAGYRKPFSAAVTVASATVGPIIPPSIGFIIYGVLAEVSIAKLFLAGLVPGVLMASLLCAMIYWFAATGREPCPVDRRKNVREIWIAFKNGILALLAPLIILYGMTGGVITPTEAGVLAVVYSLIVGIVYREFRISALPRVLYDTVLSSAHILLLVSMASVMGYLMTQERTPNLIGGWIMSLTTNKYIILLLIDIVLLVIGCMMSGTASLIILTPIFLPIVSSLGVDLIHFGVIMGVGLVIGVATPPVGIGLYVVAEISHLQFEDVVRAALPFLIPLILVLLIITYFPQLVLLLPNALM